VAHRTVFKSVVIAMIAGLVVPATALALAGGSTGGGGGGGSSGGGGGGFSSGGDFSSGGGSSNCTGDCSGGPLVWVIVAAVLALVFAIPYWLKRGAKKSARAKEEKGRAMWRAADAANAGDGYWNVHQLKTRVRECFFPIQESWEKRDVTASRPFVSDALYERHKLQLDGLEKQGRVNRISDLTLDDITIVTFYNVTDDSEDRFVVKIQGSARDWMQDIDSHELLNGSLDISPFEQYWSFARHPQYGWVLDEIQQATEGAYHEQRAIVNQDEG
jgi:hypothetical protein